MNRSPDIGELAGALALAQGAISGALRNSDNPFFRSRYADLAAVWEACREPLSKNGLAVIQTTHIGKDELPVIETMLVHSSGQWIKGQIMARPVRYDKSGERHVTDDPQSIGSAITYARRYALAAMVGVAPDDDDGNAASGRKLSADQREDVEGVRKLKPKPAPESPAPAPRQATKRKPGTISTQQKARLWTIANEKRLELLMTDAAMEDMVRSIIGQIGLVTTTEIPTDKYDGVISAIKAYKAPAEKNA